MQTWVNFDQFSDTLPDHALREISIRAALPDEIAPTCDALQKHHYLGAPPRHNCDLVHLAVRGEQVVAILVWTRAARRLAARDQWVGWDPHTRARRVPLLVQNNRFLLLAATRQPNLASRVLGLSVAELPAHWQQRYGCTPLLAETFIDPELYQGTCYKAAGWLEVGATAGFARSGNDFFVEHRKPKRLWLRTLADDARQRLQDPNTELAGQNSDGFGQSPVPVKTATSLADALASVPDYRTRRGRQFPLNAMLASAVLALCCGARNVADIYRFTRELNPAHRRALRFRRLSGNLKDVPTPGEGCWRKVLRKIDSGLIARTITDWQLSQTKVPAILAIDGKTLHRGLATLVSLVDAQTGEPVAQTACAGAGHESRLAEELTEQMPEGSLDNKVVVGDALYTNPKIQRRLVQDHGAITIFQIKDNQPTVSALSTQTLEAAAPLFSLHPPSPATAASTCATSVRRQSPPNRSASPTRQP
jgi:hypothetical protein